MRRSTRLTNAFSKKLENHAYALHQMFYNFTRIHRTLRVTPAMAAGVTDRLWDMTDIVKVLEDWEADATAGTTYSVEKEWIGAGFHVRMESRYGVLPSQFGFKTVADAQAFIEAEEAKHRPGRKRKAAKMLLWVVRILCVGVQLLLLAVAFVIYFFVAQPSGSDSDNRPLTAPSAEPKAKSN